MKTSNKLQRIPLRDIDPCAHPRKLDQKAVDMLAASIREIGLLNPITVTPCPTMGAELQAQRWVLVAGQHRADACRSLGWTEIDAFVVEGARYLDAELMSIDENLCRAELTASQRAAATKRRKQIWEVLHPPAQGGKTIPTLGGDQKVGFAAATAEATGQSKRSINQHIARAEVLGDETLSKVTGTSLDKGVELDALVKLPEARRKDLIERAAAGERVTARSAPKLPTWSNKKRDVADRVVAELRSSAAAFKRAASSAEAVREITGKQLADLRKKLAKAMELLDRLEAEAEGGPITAHQPSNFGHHTAARSSCTMRKVTWNGNQAIKIDRAGLRLLAQALTKAIQQTKSSDGATGLKSDRR